MATARTTPDRPRIWPISAAAALLGLAQSGLLVALPLLGSTSGLALSRWAALILIGSMLFALGSPFWGRVADRYGPYPVVVLALTGYAVSFG